MYIQPFPCLHSFFALLIAGVFQLHYDELLTKQKEIDELQAVVTALSLGEREGL
jgi:hypothetical protein